MYNYVSMRVILSKIKVMRKKLKRFFVSFYLLSKKIIFKKPLLSVVVLLLCVICSVFVFYSIKGNAVNNIDINSSIDSPKVPLSSDLLKPYSDINKGVTEKQETQSDVDSNTSAGNGARPSTSTPIGSQQNAVQPFADTLLVSSNNVTVGGKNNIVLAEIYVSRQSGYNMLPTSIITPGYIPANLSWYDPDPVMGTDTSISKTKKMIIRYTSYFDDLSSGSQVITLRDVSGNTGSFNLSWSPTPNMYITQESYTRRDLPDFIVYTVNINIMTNSVVEPSGTISVNFSRSRCREGSNHSVVVPYTGQKMISAECWVERYIPPPPPGIPTFGSEGLLNYHVTIALPNNVYLSSGVIWNELGANFDR